MGMKRAHLWISGIVQGVCFRYYTQSKAKEFGVSGWAKNRPDGKVEVVIEGDNERVNRMVGWCGMGPPHAHVADVRAEWEEYRGEFQGFSIR